ncbi:hypothetical protein D9611_000304 [Ephemerocybe angulata]|uniref:Uncharacterized protein n=1 Tax=Ephemerocybe angulata TaxID=980116 RepID=A0A8H5BMW7_9AGAR|nr:hypothetical protein D9611_000304 [Tulosesus angulatus]
MSVAGRMASHPANAPPPLASSRSPSINTVNMGSNVPSDPISSLKVSSNNIAAGIGEALEALIEAASMSPMSTKPIFVEWEGRIMALGRKRMASMNGRVLFVGEAEGDYVEVDLDAWEELAPHIERLRIIS